MFILVCELRVLRHQREGRLLGQRRLREGVILWQRVEVLRQLAALDSQLLHREIGNHATQLDLVQELQGKVVLPEFNQLRREGQSRQAARMVLQHLRQVIRVAQTEPHRV